MNPTKKFWYDENSEPPKNYIWVKNNKQYEFSVNERRWKEINSSEESGSSSGNLSVAAEILNELVPAGKSQPIYFGIKNEDTIEILNFKKAAYLGPFSKPTPDMVVCELPYDDSSTDLPLSFTVFSYGTEPYVGMPMQIRIEGSGTFIVHYIKEVTELCKTQPITINGIDYTAIWEDVIS